MSCEGARQELGAYVVGALDELQAAAVCAHLETCGSCRTELAELSSLPALLALVPLAEAAADGARSGELPPPPGMLERVLAAASAERRAQRRRRLVVGAAAGLAAAAAVAVPLALGDSPDERTRDAVLVASDTATGVRGEVDVRQVGWGTLVHVRLDGVPGGERCSLVAVDRRGGRETAATWAVPARGYRGTGSAIEVPGGVSFRTADVDRFEVVTADGRRLLTVPGSR